jgi:hypothetical protein
MALDFKFGAEYRVRFYTINNGWGTNLGNNEGAQSEHGVQSRIRPRFDVSDDNGNMTATLRLEIGDIEWGNGGGAAGVDNGQTLGAGSSRTGNGSGGGLGLDGVNVETKWAYVDFASPFGIPLRWRAGLQPWYEFKGIIVDDDSVGVRAYGKASIVNYEVGWYRAGCGPATNTPGVSPITNPQGNNAFRPNCSNALDNNYDFYEAKVGLAAAKWLNPTLYYIYGANAATNTTVLANPAGPGNDVIVTKPVTSNFFGIDVTGDAGFLSYDLDFVAGAMNGGPTGNYTGSGTFANGGNRVKTKGWMLDGAVHVPIGPLTVHAMGSYATGDKQNGGSSEAMPYISPSWNGAGGMYEIIGSGGTFDMVTPTQDYPAGLWMLGFGLEYRPVKALWLRAVYGYAGFVSKRSNCAYSNGRAAGECFGPSYTGKGFTSPTVVGGQVTAGGQGGMAGESTLGQEITLRADYDLWTNFKVQGNIGWLIPGTGETVGKYVLQLLYSF